MINQAANLRKIREHLGWSQAKMAKYIERPTRTYEDWERGVRNPPTGQINLIIRLLIAREC